MLLAVSRTRPGLRALSAQGHRRGSIFAVAVLLRQTGTADLAAGPLKVRADLMRGQPRHKVDGKIMGECASAQIRALQRATEMRTPARVGF